MEKSSLTRQGDYDTGELEIFEYKYIIRTVKDVEDLLDKCVARGKDKVLRSVNCIVDYRIMLQHGIFPFKTAESLDVDRLTMDDASFAYWHNDQRQRVATNYQNKHVWYYNTLETHKRNAIQKAISLPLMYIAPHLIYKQSKRPVTEMDIFRSSISTVVNISDIVNGTVTINGEMWSTIPVTRYAEGMSKGKYYDSTVEKCATSKWCGTFYYHEPESTTFLAYKTSRTFFNKTAVLITLGKERGMPYKEAEYVNINLDLHDHMRGVLPVDLKLTPVQYANMYGTRYDKMMAKQIPNIPHYIGATDPHSLYALEDNMDQVLCLEGKKLGLDIIILESMIGQYSVVSEVLDCRDRVESFKNLIYTNKI